MTTTLWPVLPKDDALNGLGVIEQALIEFPGDTHIIVAKINRKRLTVEDDDGGSSTPKARVLHVEVITNPGHLELVSDALKAAQTARTGGRVLPFGEGNADQDNGRGSGDDD